MFKKNETKIRIIE